MNIPQNSQSKPDILFIGLGQMGAPMARRLLSAGFTVHGLDASASVQDGFNASATSRIAARPDRQVGASVVITMLPNGKVVQDVLLGPKGVVRDLAAGTIVIDMSSSAPTDTLALKQQLATHEIALVDAPVSGGVARAVDGTLAIMTGGDAGDVERVLPILSAMGKTVFQTGPSGSGHAMKALNNYVSAAGLIAACEALIVGRSFGLAPDTIIDVLNASSGRNNSTEIKMKPFVISEKFNSGFALALMAKDLRIAADLAAHLNLETREMSLVAELWDTAKNAMPTGADHTEIFRFLADGASKAR